MAEKTEYRSRADKQFVWYDNVGDLLLDIQDERVKELVALLEVLTDPKSEEVESSISRSTLKSMVKDALRLFRSNDHDGSSHKAANSLYDSIRSAQNPTGLSSKPKKGGSKRQNKSKKSKTT
tara:strand:- start:31 stop:396 length:366 start_codon:yes stop_codon:yes gene_type:complete